MKFPEEYPFLKNNKIFADAFALVPIRYEDRLDIMKWRNEQIYHLRQTEPLTKNIQDQYFKTVVANLFEQIRPNQILFSFLKKEICIGYGGLVHINWIDKHAEISFVMDTKEEEEYFNIYWKRFLTLIEIVAFNELKLHKIFIYAFDLRPSLYDAAEKSGFFKDATLKEHCFFNEEYIDVVIYSKIKAN